MSRMLARWGFGLVLAISAGWTISELLRLAANILERIALLESYALTYPKERTFSVLVSWHQTDLLTVCLVFLLLTSVLIAATAIIWEGTR